MSWSAVDVRSPAETRDTVAAWLVGRTGHAVEERDDGMIVGFVRSPDEAHHVLDQLRARFGDAIVATERSLPEVDWTQQWREGLGPRRIGSLTITPSWVPADPGASLVIIDPESAFGTGEHGSTRGALALLEANLRRGARVIDVGSGSGILAIAAARLGAARAVGIEVDPDAEPIAKANVARNAVEATVRLVVGDAQVLLPLLGPADLILSNILRSVNELLLPEIRAALAPRGIAIFAGMELAERDAFLEALAAAALRPVEEVIDEGWWSVAARAF